MIENQIDKRIVEFGSLKDEPADVAYWLSRTPEDRLTGVEFLNRQFYSYEGAEQELRRFFEVAESKGG